MGDLVVQRPEGLYCPPGDFYIDPWRPVDRAVITHAHADHARRGHGHYLAAAPAARACCAPGWATSRLQTLAYGERINHHGVTVSLHPAGHVLGSAQVRLEHGGQVWVARATTRWPPTAPARRSSRCAATCSSPNPPLACPSTAGQPAGRAVCRHQRLVAGQRQRGPRQRAAVLQLRQGAAHAGGVDASIGPIVVHGAVEPLNRAYRAPVWRCPPPGVTDPCHRQGRLLQPRAGAVPARRPLAGPWLKRFGDYSDAFASGWMQLRGAPPRGATTAALC
jgi:putative mRNA 3-end processing factor